MQYFKRIFKYVWPQRSRVVIVIITALITAMLYSLSIMSLLPFLKVMMGEENIHAWLDRKVCDQRFQVDFYVPDAADYADEGVANSLTLTKVEEDSPFVEVGIKPFDKIVGVGSLVADNKVPFPKLLHELASAPDDSTVPVQYARINNDQDIEIKQIQINTGQMSRYTRLVVDAVQWVSGLIPRGEISNKVKMAAMKLIVYLIVLVTIIRCLTKFIQQYWANKVVNTAVTDFREEAFSHIMEVPIGFFSRISPSDAMSRILGDVNGIGRGVSFIFGRGLLEPLKALFCVAGAMMINMNLVLIFLAGAPLLLGFTGFLGKKMKKHTRRSLRGTALILGKLEDVINSLRVVKVYNRQDYERKSFGNVNQSFLNQTLKVAKVEAITMPTLEILGMFAMTLALLVGIKWVVNSNMQSSSFFILIGLLGMAAESVRRGSDIWNRVQAADASAKRVYEILDADVESEKADAIKLLPLKRSIEFKNVSFTYPNSKNAVLKNIDLTIEAGRTVAFVGPNGSGKTTMVNLIPRFYDVDSGSILVDGVNIADATLYSLRNQISMVTQNVVTFHDTIAANIAYGKADATREEIVDAAKRSFAHEFIEQLPDGYDTVVGEHGVGLSGGQLQRIVIARAIIKNPSILIFDEATSQVDADSENKIHKALDDLMQDRTCILIAHRFSTVISADTIVVMDNGQVRAQGKHEELIKSCSLYKNLYETQLMAQ